MLREDDFVLVPSACEFTMSSLERPSADDYETAPVALPNGEFRVGILTGHRILDCWFAIALSARQTPPIPLLAQLVHVRGERRLAILVQTRG